MINNSESDDSSFVLGNLDINCYYSSINSTILSSVDFIFVIQRDAFIFFAEAIESSDLCINFLQQGKLLFVDGHIDSAAHGILDLLFS